MASLIVVAFLTNLVVALPALSGATEYVVGGYSSWTLNFNYADWAQGRQFLVGDALLFEYPRGYDSVIEVTAYEFETCSIPLASEVLTSGNDMIILETPGRHWFISGAGNGFNCHAGEKLVVSVLPTYGQALSSFPASSEAPAPMSFQLPLPESSEAPAPVPFLFPFPESSLAPAPSPFLFPFPESSQAPAPSPFLFPFPASPEAPAPSPIISDTF